MRSIFLLAILITSAHNAFAALCSELYDSGSADTSKGPCTPDPGEDTDAAKKAIVDLINAARHMDPTVGPLKEAALAVKRDYPNDKEKRLAAETPYREKKMAQDQLYHDALKQIADLYHVGPAETEKTIAKPYDPALEWMSGLTAKWDPQVTDSGQGIDLAVKIRGNDAQDHYLGQTKMDPNADDGIEAVTLEDGRVFITAGLLKLALKTTDSNGNTGNLGLVASVLYHEAVHFNRLSWPSRIKDDPSVERSWASMQEEERSAYRAQFAANAAFELGADDVARIKERRDFFIQAAKDISSRTSYNPTPETATGWQNYYATQINLGDDYDRLKADVEAARKEQERKAAEDEARRRQEQAERDAARSKDSTEAAVKMCGFEYIYDYPPPSSPDPNTPHFMGFRPIGGNRLHLYRFPSVKTIDELKVTLMLAHACATVTTGGAEKADTPCNEGISILKGHSDDPLFANRISANVTVRSSIRVSDDDQTYYYPCVADKLKLLQSSLNEDHFKSLFESEAKINVQLNKSEFSQNQTDVEVWRNRETRSQEPVNGGGRSALLPTKHCAASRNGVCVWWSN
jgi:hypothetical protein